MIAPPVGLDAAVVLRARASGELDWIDALLAAPVERPAVRVWVYPKTTIVLGCGQRPTAGDRLRANATGIDLVVRQSGGGAVLAGPWMLGASIAVPPGHAFAALPLAASYRWLGRACVQWLDAMGIASWSLPLDAHTQGAASWACFARTSWWEVQCGGRKIIGFAQLRRRHGVIFTAGALLAPPPWPLLCAVLGKPHEEALALAARTVACEQLLARPVNAEWAASTLCQRIVRALS
jgi:lipoate-protein ligase A